MYGHEGDAAMTKTRRQLSVGSDLANVLAVYFPQINLSREDAVFKYQLTSDLVEFFSSPPSQTILSQVPAVFSWFEVLCFNFRAAIYIYQTGFICYASINLCVIIV